ncbi:phosphotransferase family protein [Pelagibacterium limicola]|uniref:phosphotransferase family protein n=1 Tax=Pelagibacterium limicola TaxID=2791022 RepID=UPI0018AFB8F4|nr:aminoglycoside phosphotransferase family protein [Pelagibacterium limicola]
MDLQIGSSIGSGRLAEIFAHGSDVIKLYPPGQGKEKAFREAANLSVLEGTNLPIPAVLAVGQFGDRWGLKMSRAPEATIPLDDDRRPRLMAGLHWRIHQVRGKPLTGLRRKLRRNIESASQLSGGAPAILLSRLDSLPDDDRVCHGDFHPNNIMGSEATPFVVDWLDATSGPAQADACRTYLLLLFHAPALADKYLAAYAKTSGWPEEQILAWLPLVAAARLAENVPDEEPRLLALAAAAV